MGKEIKAFAHNVDRLYNTSGSHAEEVEQLSSELVSQFLDRAKETVDMCGDELLSEARDCACYQKLWAAASGIQKMRESLDK